MHKLFCTINRLIIISLFFLYLPLVFAEINKQDQLKTPTDVVSAFYDNKIKNINISEELRYETLIYACERGLVDVIDMLLEKGAVKDIDRTNNIDQTPLMTSSYQCEDQVAALLVKTGADVNKKVDCGIFAILPLPVCSENALIQASNHGCGKIIELLLNNGANVNYQDAGGRTALMHAAQQWKAAGVEALLNKSSGIDVNIADNWGMTALMWAAKASCPAAVEAILKHGVQINLQDKEGNTALMWAAKAYMYHDRAVSIIEMLIQNGADPNIKNIYNKTAADCARENGCLSCANILENAPIIEFVNERAKEEGLAEDEAQEIIAELANERVIKENIEKLSGYHANKELLAEELSEVLSGKTPIKDKDNKISFVEAKIKNDSNSNYIKNPVQCSEEIIAKKELIKNEWREITADTGELVISFIPVAGPPISVAFSQLIKGEFDATQLQAGFAWGAADLAGFGFIKKIKNLEKFVTTVAKIAPNIKITKNVGWKVGEDYNKLTAKGAEPVWSTVKRRFWKNKAATLTAEEAADLEARMAGNVERMKQGKPPQQINKDKIERLGGNGLESKELHHDPIPKRDGGKLVEDLWPQEHAAKDEFRRPGY